MAVSLTECLKEAISDAVSGPVTLKEGGLTITITGGRVAGYAKPSTPEELEAFQQLILENAQSYPDPEDLGTPESPAGDWLT